MESNLFLETKINNKSLRLDGSFDPKCYFQYGNSLLKLSLSGLKKAGTQLPTLRRP